MGKKKPKAAARAAAFYISVDSMKIRRNKKKGTNDPPILFRTGRSGKSTPTKKIAIVDSIGAVVGYVTYSPDKPLKCGAVCYVQLLHKPIVESGSICSGD